MSILHIESLVASKAVRVVQAACYNGRNRDVVDFGSRRAHGPEAGILAARAAYVGGCSGTSNIYAAQRFDIPVYGTMAHSWVETFDEEMESFRKYEKVFPANTALLIDTYDTIQAIKNIVKSEIDYKAVRIDSGDLKLLSKKVRHILDENNKTHVKIIASGNLNEFKISELAKAKAPIDIFGVGTDLVTSFDVPCVGFYL